VRLLLDENASDRTFVGLLRAAAHDVEISVDALGIGASDRAILARAQETKRVIVTHDCADFRELVSNKPGHPGLLLIYSGTMHPAPTLVRAIERIDCYFPAMNDLAISLKDVSS